MSIHLFPLHACAPATLRPPVPGRQGALWDQASRGREASGCGSRGSSRAMAFGSGEGAGRGATSCEQLTHRSGRHWSTDCWNAVSSWSPPTIFASPGERGGRQPWGDRRPRRPPDERSGRGQTTQTANPKAALIHTPIQPQLRAGAGSQHKAYMAGMAISPPPSPLPRVTVERDS